ncbi:hypothetical protein Lal_00040300, partial [Lupinus albus]
MLLSTSVNKPDQKWQWLSDGILHSQELFLIIKDWCLVMNIAKSNFVGNVKKYFNEIAELERLSPMPYPNGYIT